MSRHRFINPFNRRDVAAYRAELDDAEARQCESCGEEQSSLDDLDDGRCAECRSEDEEGEGDE